MKATLSLICIFIAIGFCKAQSNVAFSMKAHTSLITELVKIPASDLVASCSYDKTIKLWNSKTFEYEAEIRGEIGAEGLGSYSGMAVSPDGKLLAAACIAYPVNGIEGTVLGVRIFDIKTRKLVHLLRIGQGNLDGLQFADNQTLLVAQNSNLQIYNLTNLKAVENINAPENTGFSKIVVHKSKILISCDDGIIYEFNLQNKSLTPYFNTGKPIATFNYYDLSQSLYYSDYNGYIYSVSNGILKDSLYTEAQAIEIEVSTSGDQVLIGLYYAESSVLMAKIHNGKFQKPTAIPEQAGLVGALQFIDNCHFISSGGYGYSCNFYNSCNGNLQLLRSHQSEAMPIMAACSYGGSIAFSTEQSFNESSFPYRWMFNTGTHETIKIIPFGSLLYMLGKPKIEMENWKLELNRGAAGYEVWIYKDGKYFNKISDIDAYSYTFLPNGMIAIGATKGTLRVYDIYGIEAASLVGHTSDVTSLTLDPLNEYMVSSSTDGTIRFWDINLLTYNDEFNTLPSDVISDSMQTEIALWGYGGLLNDSSSDAWLDIIFACFNNGSNDLGDRLFQNLVFQKALNINKVVPEMNVFISNTNEWLMWDKNMYYSGSKNGCKMIGFHINQGPEKEAKFYSFEQYELTNNRPDLIYQFFDRYDNSTQQAYYNAYLKRLNLMGIDPAKMNSESSPPALEVQSLSGTNMNQKYRLKFVVKDNAYLLSRLYITVNGVPLSNAKGFNLEPLKSKELNSQSLDQIIPEIVLSQGTNRIQIWVVNEVGLESMRETVEIQYNPSNPALPNLYIVSIGVSEYRDSRYNLEYASKDAGDILQAFKEYSSGFGTVHEYLLLNENASKESLDKIRDQLMNSSVDDQVIVFFAGHGLLDDSFNLYLATHTMDFEDPQKNGISFHSIESMLDGIPARKKLLLLDACHSGEPDKTSGLDLSALSKTYPPQPSGAKIKTYMQRGVEVSSTDDYDEKVGYQNSVNLIGELFNDLRNSSGTIIISAASAEGFALESDQWQNGVFSYVILKNLKDGTMDTNGDSVITVSELKEHIVTEVVDLTQGQQVPTMRQENISNDFNLIDLN